MFCQEQMVSTSLLQYLHRLSYYAVCIACFGNLLAPDIYKLVSKVFVFALRQIVYLSTATQWTDFDFFAHCTQV